MFKQHTKAESTEKEGSSQAHLVVECHPIMRIHFTDMVLCMITLQANRTLEH